MKFLLPENPTISPLLYQAIRDFSGDTAPSGAGEENRTLVTTLEKLRSTIELHPQRTNFSEILRCWNV